MVSFCVDMCQVCVLVSPSILLTFVSSDKIDSVRSKGTMYPMEEILVFVIFCGMCMTLLCAYMMYYSYLSIRLRERSVTDTPSSITQL
jgi:hypothetical protein